MSKNSDQIQTAPRQFKLGPLGSLNQVTKGLAKTIRAMADARTMPSAQARMTRLHMTRARLISRDNGGTELNHAAIMS